MDKYLNFGGPTFFGSNNFFQLFLRKCWNQFTTLGNRLCYIHLLILTASINGWKRFYRAANEQTIFSSFFINVINIADVKVCLMSSGTRSLRQVVLNDDNNEIEDRLCFKNSIHNDFITILKQVIKFVATVDELI